MKKLFRSSTDRKICGGCGGIAFGTGVLAYIIAAIVMPEA